MNLRIVKTFFFLYEMDKIKWEKSSFLYSRNRVVDLKQDQKITVRKRQKFFRYSSGKFWFIDRKTKWMNNNYLPYFIRINCIWVEKKAILNIFVKSTFVLLLLVEFIEQISYYLDIFFYLGTKINSSPLQDKHYFVWMTAPSTFISIFEYLLNDLLEFLFM